MPQPSPACPDCKVPMDSGFIVDFTGTQFSKQSSWVEGTAEPSWWTGSVLRRQAAVTDCDISLPDVRSTEIIRARELAALVYAARLSRTRTRLYMLEFPLGDATSCESSGTIPASSGRSDPLGPERACRSPPQGSNMTVSLACRQPLT